MFTLESICVPYLCAWCLFLQHQPGNWSREPGQGGAYCTDWGWAGTPDTPHFHTGPADWAVSTCCWSCYGRAKKNEVGNWYTTVFLHILLINLLQFLVYNFLQMTHWNIIKTLKLFNRKEQEGLQRSIDTNRRQLQSMESSRSNRLRRFGDHMPALLTAIEEALKKGHFKHRPRGPLGGN